MNRHALEDGVVLLQLQTLGGILTILGGDVAACSGQTAFLMFGAFKDYLNAITFSLLCHECDVD